MNKKLILLIFTVFYIYSNPEQIFNQIYQTNLWGDPNSVSGTGSNLFQTTSIRTFIPRLLQEFNIKTIVDAPCGDFFWMREVNLEFLDSYIGIDIVKQIIEKNNKLFAISDKKQFIHLNLLEDILPHADLILCRDCLVHFSYEDIITTIRNFKKSGATYLLTTTFPERNSNKQIKTGEWRHLNLQVYPFNFKEPLVIFNENCPEVDGKDKSLALWKLSDLLSELNT